MLSAIIGAVGGALFDKVFGTLKDLFLAYQNKQISFEELRTRSVEALIASATEVEKSHADSLARTYDSFLKFGMIYPEVRRMWVWVVASQLFVLFWHQWIIPFIVFMGWIARYPSSGTTVEWAYLLLGGCLGFGAMLLRQSSPIDTLKGLIRK